MANNHSRGRSANESHRHSSHNEGNKEHESNPTSTQLTLEIWHPAYHHEDYVEVSNHGRVATVTVHPVTAQKVRTIVKPFKTPCGYLCFIGCERSGRYNLLYVH